MLCADLLIQQIRSWAYVLTPQQITGGGSMLGSRTLWRGTLGFCRSWKFYESIFSSFHKSSICWGTWCRIARREVMFSYGADKPNWPGVLEILAFFMKHFVDVLWYGVSSRITASQHIFGFVLFQRLKKSTGFLGCLGVTQVEFFCEKYASNLFKLQRGAATENLVKVCINMKD